MSEKEASREVVGGSGPYREAGTTLASAILSARDIHNHLVLLALSRGARVLLFVVPFSNVSSTKSDGSPREKEEREREKGEELQKKTSRETSALSSLLSVSDSLDFLLLPPIRFFDDRELPEFRGAIQDADRGETKFRLYLYFAVESRGSK